MGSLEITGQGVDGAAQAQAGRNSVSYPKFFTLFTDCTTKMTNTNRHHKSSRYCVAVSNNYAIGKINRYAKNEAIDNNIICSAAASKNVRAVVQLTKKKIVIPLIKYAASLVSSVQVVCLSSVLTAATFAVDALMNK